MYEPRIYRNRIDGKDMVAFNVTVKETDLYIRAMKNLTNKTRKLVIKYREILEKYIERNEVFLTSLEPFFPGDSAPRIVKMMADSAGKAGVGPMAAVAGAMAELVGTELLEYSPEVIVENGGDIFMKSLKKRTVSVYAGESPLSDKIGLEIEPKDTPLGICTSSGTVGHSLSYGRADAVVAVSESTPLADAAATAIGNLIKRSDDIPKGIELAESVHGIKGVLIIKDDKMGVWGDLKICQMSD
ncbi:UPF0280 family protein [Chloroflexota bacterium]